MSRERKNGSLPGFTGPLWDEYRTETGEAVALEELANQSYTQQNGLAEDWLQPLLDEGLSFDGIVDLLLRSRLRPN